MSGITYLYQYDENSATIKSIKAEVYITKTLPATALKQSVSVSYFRVDENGFQVSGNPGYQIGRKLLGGTLQSNSAVSLDTNGIVIKGINSDRTC